MNMGKYPEDSWPILHNVPSYLAFWRKSYESDKELLKKIALAWWKPCKARVLNGIEIPCFATNFVRTYEAEGFSDMDAALVAQGLMMAGAGTTSATLSFFIMACCTNPSAVKRVREELEQVVGDKRLPLLEDEPNLPYIRAMIKENLRWRPISNHGEPCHIVCVSGLGNTKYKTGMQHSTTEEDWYKGYRIPKGTVIIANSYSIHQDATKFKDADSFVPERYLNYPHSAVDAVSLKNPEERDHFAYGVGRRTCAGIHVAEINLFIAVSHLLWGFDIANAKDGSGATIPIDTLGYNGKPCPGFSA